MSAKKSWTSKELEVLKELFPRGGYPLVQQKLYRSRSSIANRVARLGLKIDKSIYIRSTKNKANLKIRGEKNGLWKGDKVKYVALHDWVKRYFPKTRLCFLCKTKPAFDLANISGKYRRDLNDWCWLCRLCHMKSDGRIFNLNYSERRVVTH